jgi:hypothetical protein
MSRRKVLEWWETQVENCEVTRQGLWPVAISPMKMDEPKAPTAVRGPSGITYHPKVKANVIPYCSEDQLISHDLRDGNHERQVGTSVQALRASVDDTPLGKVIPCDIHKLANSLQLRKDCGLCGIPIECLRHLPRRPLVHLTDLFNDYIRLFYVAMPPKEAKVIT